MRCSKPALRPGEGAQDGEDAAGRLAAEGAALTERTSHMALTMTLPRGGWSAFSFASAFAHLWASRTMAAWARAQGRASAALAQLIASLRMSALALRAAATALAFDLGFRGLRVATLTMRPSASGGRVGDGVSKSAAAGDRSKDDQPMHDPWRAIAQFSSAEAGHDTAAARLMTDAAAAAWSDAACAWLSGAAALSAETGSAFARMCARQAQAVRAVADARAEPLSAVPVMADLWRDQLRECARLGAVWSDAAARAAGLTADQAEAALGQAVADSTAGRRARLSVVGVGD